MRVTESGESGRESSRKKVKSTEREIMRDNKYEVERERKRNLFLPAFGTPTKPTSATSLSSSLSHLFSPP